MLIPLCRSDVRVPEDHLTTRIEAPLCIRAYIPKSWIVTHTLRGEAISSIPPPVFTEGDTTSKS